MVDPRPSKQEGYLIIAKDIALRSPCTRRRFGAILVRDDTIIATGYNGSARGTTNCGVDCGCLKDMNLEASMRSYDHCPAVHAEMNVIINAARSGVITIGSTMYLGEIDGTIKGMDGPCFLCRRFMIQAGIYYCYYIKDGEIVKECLLDWTLKENEWIAKQQI